MATSVIKSRVAQNLGAVSTSAGASTSYVTFGIPDTSQTYKGELTLTAAGGAVTSPTWLLACSIDNGATWFTLSPSSTALVNAAAGANGGTAVTWVAQYDVSGLAGSLFTFGLTAGSAIPAMIIWALVG